MSARSPTPGLVDCIGMESHDAECLTTGFIDGDKSHRASII
jgi:hypothetical protein